MQFINQNVYIILVRKQLWHRSLLLWKHWVSIELLKTLSSMFDSINKITNKIRKKEFRGEGVAITACVNWARNHCIIMIKALQGGILYAIEFFKCSKSVLSVHSLASNRALTQGNSFPQPTIAPKSLLGIREVFCLSRNGKHAERYKKWDTGNLLYKSIFLYGLHQFWNNTWHYSTCYRLLCRHIQCHVIGRCAVQL